MNLHVRRSSNTLSSLRRLEGSRRKLLDKLEFVWRPFSRIPPHPKLLHSHTPRRKSQENITQSRLFCYHSYSEKVPLHLAIFCF